MTKDKGHSAHRQAVGELHDFAVAIAEYMASGERTGALGGGVFIPAALLGRIAGAIDRLGEGGGSTARASEAGLYDRNRYADARHWLGDFASEWRDLRDSGRSIAIEDTRLRAFIGDVIVVYEHDTGKPAMALREREGVGVDAAEAAEANRMMIGGVAAREAILALVNGCEGIIARLGVKRGHVDDAFNEGVAESLQAWCNDVKREIMSVVLVKEEIFAKLSRDAAACGEIAREFGCLGPEGLSVEGLKAAVDKRCARATFDARRLVESEARGTIETSLAGLITGCKSAAKDAANKAAGCDLDGQSRSFIGKSIAYGDAAEWSENVLAYLLKRTGGES